MKVAALRAERGQKIDAMKALVANDEALTAEQDVQYVRLKDEVKAIDTRITRALETQELSASEAKPVNDNVSRVPASPETDAYVKDASLVVGGIVRMAAMTKGNIRHAAEMVGEIYGENHPVAKAIGQSSKALMSSVGSAGGFVVPPDFVASIIPLLYPRTAIRKAGARTIPMPNGTMTLPKMTGSSQAQWVGETKAPGESGPTFGQVVATARKLMALVPVSNDMMRYAPAAFDGKVRDDLVLQIALAEDSAFIRSAGTQHTPRGLKSFLSSGTIIASNPVFTLTTASMELGGLQTKLELSNVPMIKPSWIMNPRTKNYLMNVQNAQGAYVFRDEMVRGTLLSWPFFTTTQMPINLTVGPNSDCSEIYAADMNEAVIYESRQLELSISTEASYLDAGGNRQDAFSQDISLVRAITAEDFQMDHDEGVACLTGVRWSPTLS